MSDAMFDRFEALIPTGREDVPVAALSKLLKEIPEPSEETRISINLIDQFGSATKLRVPQDDGIQLWLGHCVGAFHEWPRCEKFFLFAIQRTGEVISGYATGIEDDKQPNLPALRLQSDLDRISRDHIRKLEASLKTPPVPTKHSRTHDWFSPISYTDGPSVVFAPGLSARFFVRQTDEKMLIVQPSRCGGWYSELWQKAV